MEKNGQSHGVFLLNSNGIGMRQRCVTRTVLCVMSFTAVSENDLALVINSDSYGDEYRMTDIVTSPSSIKLFQYHLENTFFGDLSAISCWHFLGLCSNLSLLFRPL